MTPHHRAGKAFDVGLPLAFIAIGAPGTTGKMMERKHHPTASKTPHPYSGRKPAADASTHEPADEHVTHVDARAERRRSLREKDPLDSAFEGRDAPRTGNATDTEQRFAEATRAGMDPYVAHRYAASGLSLDEWRRKFGSGVSREGRQLSKPDKHKPPPRKRATAAGKPNRR